MKRFALIAALLVATGPTAQQKAQSGPGAMLRGLDKVSGQTVDDLRNGETNETLDHVIGGLGVDMASEHAESHVV